MCRKRWRECVESQDDEVKAAWSEVPMLQGHGQTDFAVGVNGGRWLHSFCQEELGMRRCEYIEFRGGHTIPAELAARFVDLVTGCATSFGVVFCKKKVVKVS